MAPTLQHRTLDRFSKHSTSPKSTKSLSVRAVYSLPVPPTVLGDRDSFWNSRGWRCSYGGAARCVCVCVCLCVCVCVCSLSPRLSISAVQSILCTPWLQKFISAEFPLTVQVTCRKISQNSMLGTQTSGLSFHLLGCYLPHVFFKFQLFFIS